MTSQTNKKQWKFSAVEWEALEEVFHKFIKIHQNSKVALLTKKQL